MQLLKTEMPDWTMISVQLEGEIIKPEDLPSVELPEIDYKGGVILDGRAPIWLYAFLISKWHIASWIAINDPKLGAVVVKSHNPQIKVGSVQSTALVI